MIDKKQNDFDNQNVYGKFKRMLMSVMVLKLNI